MGAYPSIGDTRVVLQFSRSLKKTKYGMVSASNFSLVSRLVYSVEIKQVPQGQWTIPSVQNFRQYEHWILEEISQSLPRTLDEHQLAT